MDARPHEPLAAVWLDQAGRDLHQCRFAGSIAPDDTKPFARLNHQVGALKQGTSPETEGNIRQCQKRWRHGAPSTGMLGPRQGQWFTLSGLLDRSLQSGYRIRGGATGNLKGQSMSNRVSHVTIVGGGTAGWLAAALLHAGLNRRNDAPDVRLTVIESPNISSIGVGEATTISMSKTCAQLGLEEKDFIKRCNASFKSAVKFRNWDHEPDGSPKTYFHPFNAPPYLHSHNSAYHWLAWRRQGNTGGLAETVLPSMAAILANKAPITGSNKDFEGYFPYAFHFDAALFADYMTEYATSVGVEHVQDDVTAVNLDERGFVSSLTLKERGDWPIEFVIDCTGFRGLIIKEALDEPFLPYGDYLLCDKGFGSPDSTRKAGRSGALYHFDRAWQRLVLAGSAIPPARHRLCLLFGLRQWTIRRSVSSVVT